MIGAVIRMQSCYLECDSTEPTREVNIHLLTGLHPFDLYSVSEDRWVWRQFLTQPVSTELRRVGGCGGGDNADDVGLWVT